MVELHVAHLYLPASGQAVVTGAIPSSPRFLPPFFIAHRVQQSHCSSIFHRVLLTPAPALSACHFVHKKKSQRIYTSMHSAGLELTKPTYTSSRITSYATGAYVQRRPLIFFLQFFPVFFSFFFSFLYSLFLRSSLCFVVFSHAVR